VEYNNESVLPDEYPVFPDYFYLADGKVVQSPIRGDVASLKSVLKAQEIKRCDAVGRGLRVYGQD
jgi:hypothetical protein